MDKNQIEKIKCSNSHKCLSHIVFVVDEALRESNSLGSGIEFLQVQKKEKKKKVS